MCTAGSRISLLAAAVWFLEGIIFFLKNKVPCIYGGMVYTLDIATNDLVTLDALLCADSKKVGLQVQIQRSFPTCVQGEGLYFLYGWAHVYKCLHAKYEASMRRVHIYVYVQSTGVSVCMQYIFV